MYKPSEYYFVLAYIVGVLKLFGDYENSAGIISGIFWQQVMLLSFKQNKQLKSIIF